LRKVTGAKWHIKPIPLGSWSPVRVHPVNNVAEVVLPFSDTYGWALFAGRLLHARDVRERLVGQDWLLVYPPTHADAVLKAGYPDYFEAKKLTDQGDIDAALKLYSSEMSKKPKNANLAREIIALCKAVERPDLAKLYAKRAIEVGVDARDLLVQYADDQVDTAKAIVYYRKACHASLFVDPPSLIKLGRAYQKNGQLALAESCWRRAYQIATNLERIELRRLMGMPDSPSFFGAGSPLDKKE
jgi:tetratricopeptide (TPR) repeat protein